MDQEECVAWICACYAGDRSLAEARQRLQVLCGAKKPGTPRIP
ncbi:hypothetical protein PCL1606_27490 [Pseudomonas chlororaphis]|uniref:Uncharacterized protein n=1 Tax=Pseudomonas chlororaphis TaxID=587753 RepID=A0A0D5XZI2_9PSED|nr:hypothetical protein PCL1606_27490 [Pseudomonas chlororaphis]